MQNPPTYPELTLDPRLLPSDGQQLRGELPPEVFALPPTDSAKPLSPLRYDLHLQRDDEGENLLITGSIEAEFQVDCVACLEPLQLLVEINPYENDIFIKNEAIINLTELLREDILFTLPSYPRCEDSSVSPRDCPARDRFIPDITDDSEPSSPPPASGTWDALDQLKR
jgi:uncharacterized protein